MTDVNFSECEAKDGASFVIEVEKGASFKFNFLRIQLIDCQADKSIVVIVIHNGKSQVNFIQLYASNNKCYGHILFIECDDTDVHINHSTINLFDNVVPINVTNSLSLSIYDTNISSLQNDTFFEGFVYSDADHNSFMFIRLLLALANCDYIFDVLNSGSLKADYIAINMPYCTKELVVFKVDSDPNLALWDYPRVFVDIVSCALVNTSWIIVQAYERIDTWATMGPNVSPTLPDTP